jgi:cyclopropane-fatty-acyl-phospholipid synthase
VAALRTTGPLRRELEAAVPDRPFRLTFWDGSELPPSNGGQAPTLHVRSPAALAHALRAPGQLGLGRAYVSGALEVDDLDRVIELLDGYRPQPIDRSARLRLAVAAARAVGPMRPPPVPETELRPRGQRHSPERDKRSVRHHYDVSNDFFALFLDESMTYSCAFFSRDGSSLEAAQNAKLELTCAKLDLRAGERVLDVGCGWGSFAIHAAREHGVAVTGITLSEPQAQLARRRAEEAGVADRVDRLLGDFVERAHELEPADVVVMHKVVCCYPDYRALVGAGADRASRYLMLTFPRQSWWVRAGIAAANAIEWARRHKFRAYVHPPAAILAVAEARGFRSVGERRGAIWQLAALERN